MEEQSSDRGLGVPGRCYLLELPAELRLQIYVHALAPTGSIALTSTREKRKATIPIVGPTLLRTCRGVYQEAADILYTDNSICITIDAHDTCWPTISEARLPQRVLEKIQHMTIILDCTTFSRAAYEDVDWMALTALTSLKTLRITILRVIGNPGGPMRLTSVRHPDMYDRLLIQVLERIPASTQVIYGTADDCEERKIVDAVKARRQLGLTGSLQVLEVDGESLTDLSQSEEVQVAEQGCKSGGVEDVFAEYRSDRIVELSSR